MNDYWPIISDRHQQKVRQLAEAHEITLDRAFRNIIRHLESELGHLSRMHGFRHFLTARHIEQMIDLITKR